MNSFFHSTILTQKILCKLTSFWYIGNNRFVSVNRGTPLTVYRTSAEISQFCFHICVQDNGGGGWMTVQRNRWFLHSWVYSISRNRLCLLVSLVTFLNYPLQLYAKWECVFICACLCMLSCGCDSSQLCKGKWFRLFLFVSCLCSLCFYLIKEFLLKATDNLVSKVFWNI